MNGQLALIMIISGHKTAANRSFFKPKASSLYVKAEKQNCATQAWGIASALFVFDIFKVASILV